MLLRSWPLLVALVLIGCESAPIQVTPPVDVPAVTAQNRTTQKHIARTRQHISKSQEQQIKTATDLEGAKKDLDELLKK